MSRRLGVLLLMLLAMGCDGPAPAVDAGSTSDASAGVDASTGAMDAGDVDAGDVARDAGSSDAGAFDDAGPADGGPPDGGGCPPDECCWETVETRAGVFHTVTEAAPQLVVQPLAPGEGFFCARLGYTIQTADNLAETDAAYEGCPIYSHMATIEGDGPEARVQSTAFFRFLRIGCAPRRPGAVELNAYNERMDGSQTQTGPWVPGGTYRVVHEVRPFTSSIQLYAMDGTAVGPRIEVDITGATVAHNRDTRFVFGLDRVSTGAFFPYFDAVYSDLEIEVDAAPAP